RFNSGSLTSLLWTSKMIYGITNFYKGKHELDISSGVIQLPRDIINSWNFRNGSKRNQTKPPYFNAGICKGVYGKDHLRLYDPLITQELMNNHVISYDDFVQIQESEHDSLRTRWRLSDGGLVMPLSVKSLFEGNDLVTLVGSDEYVDILGKESIMDYNKYHENEELQERITRLAYSF
ncbi:hypothetical protein COX97_01200, partial [Candidatus Pacearchaeota archaeon CG_4_10_14_0_2_um_filter_05_32_18]